MFSPVEFAHLHFIHDSSVLSHTMKQMNSHLTEEMQRIGKMTRDKPWEVAKPLHEAFEYMDKALTRLYRMQTAAKTDIATMLGSSRRPRQIMAAAGVLSGLFSLGLGLANHQALEALYADTQDLAKNQKALLHSLGVLKQEVTADLAELQEELNWIAYKNELEHKVDIMLHSAEDATRRWIQGVYLLLRGQLDASIISPSDLRSGFEQLSENCKSSGMRIAPMENTVEVLFSIPVSTAVVDGKIHVWIPVPVVQENSPTFDVLKLTHVPLPLREFMVELAAEGVHLAVDSDRTLHKDMSSTDLASCVQHRRFYFCGQTTFSSQDDSCAMALLKGQEAVAAQLCHKYIHKAPSVVTTTSNLTSGTRRVVVSVGTEAPIMRICPRGIERPTVVVRGHEEIELPFGCHLRAGLHTIFVPVLPKEVSLAAQGETWNPEMFLEGMKVDDVIHAIAIYNKTHIKMPLPHLKNIHERQYSSWTWQTGVCLVAGFVTLLVLSEVIYRYRAAYLYSKDLAQKSMH